MLACPIIHEQDDVTLELLDPGDNQACGNWGRDLPRRLKQLHSHWLCRYVGCQMQICKPCIVHALMRGA